MRIPITIVLITAIVSCNGRTPIKSGLEGKELPSFNLLLRDSITYFNTNNIPSGKPTVLLCVGPYCPYSRSQVEEIVKEIKTLNEIQFFIFTPYSLTEMKSFCDLYKLQKYSNIVTGIDYANFFADYYKVKGVPYIAIYGKNRRLKETFIGKVESWQIKEVANN